MTIPENISKLHKDLIEFSSEMQAASAKKMENESRIGANVYAAFYKIIAYGVTLHRAILSLCEAGWTHISAILLRTILECSANCLAIVNNEFPEYMAFKYLYHPYLQIFRDDGYPDDKREKAKIDIEQGIKNLKDETIKRKATQYINLNKINVFWFNPEEKGVSTIINNYGDSELKFTYGALSMSAHAGHLGMFLFKNNSDDIDINPTENPRKTKGALVASCRWLLELLRIRNVYEELGFDSEYKQFLERILATEKDVTG
jgi:hypothetical protein